MAAKLKYYYDLMSQPSRALYILLKINGTPFESCPVALRKGAHLTEEFKTQVNRFQRVPCIKDDDFQLSESIAIIRYLNSDGRIKNEWYPTDLQARARVDEYLEWQHLNTRMNLSLYFRSVWLDPKIFGKTPDPKKVEQLTINMENCLDQIEETWLESSKFLAGDKITVADIIGACEIEQPKMAGYDPTKNRPKLKAWMDAVRKATNPHYDEAHSLVYKIAEQAGVSSKL